MTIIRTSDGFMLIGYSTIIARFTTLDGEPAVAYHEPGDPYDCYITTNHPRGIAYFAYNVLKYEARWNPEQDKEFQERMG